MIDDLDRLAMGSSIDPSGDSSWRNHRSASGLFVARDGVRWGMPQRAGGQPPALRAGNRLPLRALSHSRRVIAYSCDIRHAAKNARYTSNNQNARTELAAETSLSRFPCFALNAACAGGRPPTRCVILQRDRFLHRLADYEQRDIDAQKSRSGLLDRVRPTPVGSILAHEATVVGTLRAFFRAANRRPALQEASALFTTRMPKFRIRQILHARTNPSKSDRNSPVR